MYIFIQVMTTKLSKNGYKIIKKEYDSKVIKEIKDELTVKPFNNFNKSQINSDVGRFNVFMESPKKPNCFNPAKRKNIDQGS